LAKIVISMAGEGRGHAARVRALTENLRERHEVVLLAPGDAHAFLAPHYAGTEVRVREIPCLRYHYRASGTIAFLGQLGRLVGQIEALLREEAPDLGITDFEPLLPRAARRLGIPFLSINHQHFLVVSDLSELPWWLRAHVSYMAPVVGAFHGGQRRTLVSSFYFPKLKPAWEGRAEQIGVFLRPEVLAARPTNAGHLVAYLRRHAPDSAISALRECGREVLIYGLGARPAEGRLCFRPISPAGFVADLAAADALISTAGNQVVGEALHLGKPVLAMPEAGNYEQYINGFFLERSGAGVSVALPSLDAPRIGAFLDRLADYRAAIRPERLNGLPRAIEVIEATLDETSRAAAAAAAARTADAERATLHRRRVATS
jgi:uncharacterized protein (TIGR00661 family)